MSKAEEASVKVVISERGRPQRVVALNPRGMIIGRASECDVVLESKQVSRQHARLYLDPFGRWILEDMQSRHGVWVNGERFQARAVIPGDRIVIASFSLSLAEEAEPVIPVSQSRPKTSTHFAEDQAADIVHAEAESQGAVTGAYLRLLNEITDRLGEMGTSSELYPEACRCLARDEKTIAAVLRVPKPPHPLPDQPDVLACFVGGWGPEEVPTPPTNVHLSRRVLEAVRASGRPVRGSNIRKAEAELGLTVTDSRSPRTVLCAPVTVAGALMDVIYLDAPADTLAEESLEFLRAVARQVNQAGKTLLMAELRSRHEALEGQLAMARRIQSRLAPVVPSVPGLDLAVWYQPAMWVGGDYCDIWAAGNEEVTFAVGDVCGKGLPAAITMANVHAVMRNTLFFCPDLQQAADHLNRYLCQTLPESVFVTLFVGRLEARTGLLQYVNAGHIPPLVFRAGAAPSDLGAPCHLPLGVSEEKIEAQTARLDSGDGLLVVTDGITEASSPDEESLGTARLREMLGACAATSAADVMKFLTRAVMDFRRNLPQEDDITALAVLVRDGGRRPEGSSA